MLRRLLLIAVAALSLAGCSGETTSTGTGESVGELMKVDAFFYREAALVPVRVEVPESEGIARAALNGLLGGPPPGYETALPQGIRLADVSIADGVATATFSSSLGAPGRQAQAQIVATLTQFSTIGAATIQIEGEGEIPLQDGAGEVLGRPATTGDYVDLTAEAPIFVAAPRRDSTVTSPVRSHGTANVFEATFQVEIWSGRKLVRTEVITATSGTGTRGTWAKTLRLPSGRVKLVFFEASPKDGSHTNETEVFLNVR
jgi:hypothetical protein